MISQESFMMSISQNPESDIPRLAFTDWLEEQGRDLERVKLIRDEIALWQLYGKERVAGKIEKLDRAISADWKRMIHLKSPQKPAWLARFDEWGIGYRRDCFVRQSKNHHYGNDECYLLIRRGFPAEMKAHPRLLLQYAKEMILDNPLELVRIVTGLNENPRELRRFQSGDFLDRNEFLSAITRFCESQL